MDTGKSYHDSEGNECSVWQMVKREPDWAANRIQEGEKAIGRVRELEAAMVIAKEAMRINLAKFSFKDEGVLFDSYKRFDSLGV